MLQYTYTWRAFAQKTEEWASIDRALCGLVGWLSAKGYRHTLEAELRFTTVRIDGEYDFTKFLPEFREKGAVVIIDTAWGVDRVLHSSVPSRRDRMGI